VVDAPGAPSPDALELLAASIGRGAVIVAAGAWTNLAQLELASPGALRTAHVVATAGWLPDQQPRGLPHWGAAMDFNVQCDTHAVAIGFAAAGKVTLVTLPASMRAQLRAGDLAEVAATGAVGELLAVQSRQYAIDNDFAALAAGHDGIADDLVNFHWDPVTGAVALDWPIATATTRMLGTVVAGGVLTFRDDEHGRPARVVTGIDAAGFRTRWLAALAAI